MGTTGILAAINEEIERLQQVKNLLGGSSVGNGLAVRKKRVLSPEGRRRIAEAQRKRWTAQKQGAK